jgi:hypothetical protein
MGVLVLASSHPVVKLIIIIVGIIVALLYFVPTGVALARKHHWIVRIALVNVLFGWTIIGWVIAFHMASTSRTKTNAYWRPPAPGGASGPGFVPAAGDDSDAAPGVPPAPLPGAVAAFNPQPPVAPFPAAQSPVAPAPVASAPVASAADAGWREDPDDPSRERYHDGTAWTLMSRPRET